MANFELEEDEGRVIAAYLLVSDKPIVRTVEIEHSRLLVDEAADGSVVGVEFLFPKQIRQDLEKVVEQYGDPSLLKSLEEFVAVC